MSDFFRRLHYVLNRRRFDRELAGDMEFHREMAARSGAVPFGNALLLREESREAWGWTWIDRLGQDVRYAFRTLRRSPSFTLAAILMLAVGIGVNVAVFSVFDLMVLRPLNVRDPATLIRFHRRGEQNFAYALPYPEMAFFREHSRTLAAVLALNDTRLAVEGEPKPVAAHFVSANFFHELGSSAAVGRVLDPLRDKAPDAEPVVVLSYGFWQRHFGSDPSVAGQTIRLNGKPATIAGVAARDFTGLSLNDPDLWAPVGQQPYFVSGSRLLTDYSVDGSGVEMWGRLRPGVTPRIAEQELASLAAELRKHQPVEIWEKERLLGEPGAFAQSLTIGNRHGSGSDNRSEIYPILGLIAALGFLILAVSCGNLGSLLLARGVSREREISIRVAVGAGRGRLVRQLFTESLVLALAGSLASLAVGYGVLRGLMTWSELPPWLDPAPDVRIAGFAMIMGIVAAVLAGLTPAVQTARQRHRGARLRQVLVGAQVAASCVLLIVAGLLVRALGHALSSNPGYDYRQVLSITPGLDAHGYTPARARAYLDGFAGRLRGLPGVASVALSVTPPLGNGSMTVGVTLDTGPLEIQLHRVDPAFFGTMKIPLLRGRVPAPGEAHVVVISDSFARAAWPGGDPLGHKFNFGEEYIVTGVAQNARLIRLEDAALVEAYIPLRDEDLASAAMVVRAASSPEAVAQSAASIARSIDPEVIPQVQLMKNQFRQKLHGAQYSATVVSLLGGVALLLACLGIVGMVAYAVSQRTREIGIRMALGAASRNVLVSILRQFSGPVAAGLAVGLIAAAMLSQLMRRQLFGISNLDPATYVAVAAMFSLTVAVAAILPARRALKVDPVEALRQT